MSAADLKPVNNTERQHRTDSATIQLESGRMMTETRKFIFSVSNINNNCLIIFFYKVKQYFVIVTWAQG